MRVAGFIRRSSLAAVGREYQKRGDVPSGAVAEIRRVDVSHDGLAANEPCGA
jgi:hypothetical protein